ncbi:MAG: 16S rRNA (guanine(527)-N(7))-methyltransferase RsmG [Lachnospiraceae bacterium]|nr:16S rRNA (guanine(527)-N(7))-methyltransferase RsmG [Lachnospiraceae bacterium]
MLMNENYLTDLLLKMGIELNKRQACQFLDYYKLLVEWNEKINLTAITDFDEVCLKHFADSVSLIRMFSSSEELNSFLSGKTLADIGTGAGFPGIPLKILCPDLKVTLFDSLDKRIRFLDTVIGCLNLEGIEAVHGRAEDLARNDYRESFDISTARAVAALPVLCEYCLPFVKTGGLFIAYKSDVSEELNSSAKALEVLGGKIVQRETFTLPESDISRTILFFEKVKSTPDTYPRKAGKPSKQPLI